IHDFGVEDGVAYIVMERLLGEDLGVRLDRETRISLSAASQMLGQVCKALSAAHGAGIVHRDLKPSNIFIERIGGDELIKVLDFGIAKQTELPRVAEATASGVLLGSPHHMSPEQARGGPIDHRSDLWSLAVVLFRAVTGHRPFDGATLPDLLMKICSDKLPVASELAPHLPPAVDRFFARALARSREERFASAREMAESFAAIAAPPPLERPPIADSRPDHPHEHHEHRIEARTDETASIRTEKATDARTAADRSSRTAKSGIRRASAWWLASAGLLAA